MNTMKIKSLILISLFCCACYTGNTLAYKQNHNNETLTQTEVEKLLTKTLAVMSTDYIDADSVPFIEETIRHRFNSGHYNEIRTVQDFADIIGTDIRRISADVHLSIQVQQSGSELTHILSHPQGKLTHNFAFETISYLHGNVGYLKFNKFDPHENAKNTVDAAFAFLKNSDQLILDMRDTIGGSPELAQYMLSYFIRENEALWKVNYRDSSEAEVYRSLPLPPNARFKQGYKVWILTSQNTASASELFIGVMQAHKKAKVVGSKTAGAGYYVGVRPINESLTFRISLAKPVVAVTEMNWEKVGIKPDITANSIDALNLLVHELIGKN